MGYPVTRFEIAALDLAAARDFYAHLFGWRIASQKGRGLNVISTGDGIDGAIVRAEDGLPTFVTVYVEVDDVEAHLRRAEELGGTIYVPAGPSLIPRERCFGIVGDPEGNLIGLVQR